ncbi:hypothetical protein CWIS_15700 [Cellulomonas sp. A375-1]|uniref:glycosyltransferase n=1 Tax=Cellulomonas sp. A375-1 TaxID=1672219 RepID=UPI00065271F6|nr:glycosyltransferase [Cellulomonas sp. A375-1]KMM44500.1 hypothetical protein CWIS_15700 [Cellulomonas sp. A375-1]
MSEAGFDRAILEDYAVIARRRGPAALARTAMRTRSRALRELLAYVASDGELDYRALADGQEPSDWRYIWLGALARTVALQELDDDDATVAVALLRRTLKKAPRERKPAYVDLLAALLFDAGDYAGAADALASYPMSEGHARALRTDLANPYVGSPFADEHAWRELFDSYFTEGEIPAPAIRPGAPTPFDGLTLDVPAVDGTQPLVSVIMTTFQPDAVTLRTSVESILRQSWRNLELVIVDDCSPGDGWSVVESIAALDDRIRAVRMPQNGGTYVARNAALDLVRGEFLTGQDDDDWSHPQRIALQMQPMLDDPTLAASQSKCLRLQENFRLQKPEYDPSRLNESSILLRRTVAERLGYYAASRRGADSEYRHRLIAMTGEPVHLVEKHLSLVRWRGSSLSRTDFKPNWRHPSRHEWIGEFRHWHATATPDELRLGRDQTDERLALPERFAVSPRARELDVVIAGDWRAYGGPQRSMIEEIMALTAAGRAVGVMHLEAARFMTARDMPLCGPVRDLIHRQVVARVLETDEDHARLLSLRYPPILQFPPVDPVALRADRVILMANQAPSERDGSDIRYRVADVTRHAHLMFGREPLWVPQGPTVRQAIEGDVEPGQLADFDLPGTLDLPEWETERSTFRSTRPVVGRHSRDDLMKWPVDSRALKAAYPFDGEVEVRVMGGTRAVQEILGAPAPTSWLTFAADELPVRTFLNSIDFFVYHQHPQAYDAFGRAVLEALATGCVAILPKVMQATFGDAALYATPEQTMPLVRRYYADPARYRAQSALAVRRVRERFSRESYAAQVAALLGES